MMRIWLSVFCLVPLALSILLSRAALDNMPRQVSVGSHRLRALVQGQGGPAVVFECFGAAYLEHMNRVQPAISKLTTTVNYDHAGHWASEPGPLPRDANRIAEELHDLLARLAVSPPYVLVGFSFGGPYVRVFAGKYPEEVAGIVLVDPTQEAFMKWLRETWPTVNQVSAEDRRERSEWGSQWDSMKQAEAAPLPDVPITLITGMRADGPFGRHVKPKWLKAHAEWLAPHARGRHIVTTRSGHGIPLSEPDLVIQAIVQMLASVRGAESPLNGVDRARP